jgi:large subunit ribosomal protein L4
MAQIKVLNLKNQVIGEEDINDGLVAAKNRPYLMHDYVVMQRRAMRQGTHSTKTRAEVSGSGKKPFRQKGTGQARQGTLIGPHQPGGGIQFGPKPRDYSTKLNKRARLEALKLAVSQKKYEGRLALVDDFNIASGKTKDAAKVIATLKAGSSALIVGELSAETKRAIRNIQGCDSLPPAGLNVYDVLRHQFLIVTKAGIKALEKRLCEVAQ